MRNSGMVWELSITILLYFVASCVRENAASNTHQKNLPIGQHTGDLVAKTALRLEISSSPDERILSANIEVKKVALLDDLGNRIEIETQKKTIELAKLSDGNTEQLALSQAPPGTYSAIAILFGTKNTVGFADSSTHELKAPLRQELRVPLKKELVIEPGGAKTLLMEIDLAQSIFEFRSEDQSYFLLRPTMYTVDQETKTGIITGQFTALDNGKPLAGATVYAESVDKSGTPRIVRRALLDSQGKYKLDRLPLFAKYKVVSLPIVKDILYEPKSSTELELSQDKPNLSFSAAFRETPQIGSLVLEVIPKVTELQADTCSIISGKAEQALLLIDTTTSRDISQERAMFGKVPAGTYRVMCTRNTIGRNGQLVHTRSQQVGVEVKANETEFAQVSF